MVNWVGRILKQAKVFFFRGDLDFQNLPYLLSLTGFLKLIFPVISSLYVKYFSEPNAFQNLMFHRF